MILRDVTRIDGAEGQAIVKDKMRAQNARAAKHKI